MIKEAKATGATIEEAQQAAVLALNAPEKADIQFEVISLPEKKVLGLFGGKQAEVRAFYEAPDEKPSKKSAPAKKNDKKRTQKTEKAEKQPTEEAEVKEEPAETVDIKDCPENVKKAYDYLCTIIAGIGVEGTKIEVQRRDKDFIFSITSEEDYSLLIGRRGETLDSIQYLVRLVANKAKGDDFQKVSVNVGNYREKREATLKDIARRT
ncbi:MAG: Jag N-terminal domain-containing protein, partial [Clostridia bacterium]|nr:Jag N-terminal domain-containing protein [Clostridia bacterium]